MTAAHWHKSILKIRKILLALREISGFCGGGYEDDKPSGALHHIGSQKLTDVSEVLTASIIRPTALMIEVVS
jgi:hypothetical protein